MRDRARTRSTPRRCPDKILVKEERSKARPCTVAAQDGYRASDRAILDVSALIVGEVRA